MKRLLPAVVRSLSAITRSLSAIAIACATLLLIAGCGSSGSSSTGAGTSATTTTSSSAGSSASTGSGRSSTGSGSSSSTGGKSAGGSSTTSKSPGLQPDTTPKYASPSPSAPVHSGVVNIAYRNIAIAPDTVRVKVGSTIKWTNYDTIPHNVTSEGGVAKFASKNFGEGGTFEITVTKPGIIHYENTLQPTTMNGTIEVVK